MKKSMKVLLMVFLVALFTGIGGQKVQASDVTLKDGKWKHGTFLSTETEQYYKINIKNSGYIKIEYTRDDDAADTDYDIYYKGKEQKIASVSKSTAGLAVKKGTYYIRISDMAYPWDEIDDDTEGTRTEDYKIRYSFKTMKEGKKVANYKKAPELKENETVSGLFYSKNKMFQDSFYKITVSKKKKVAFDYEIMSTDWLGVDMGIYNDKGKILYVNNKHQAKLATEDGPSSCWVGKGSDYVILDKGTYYFRVTAFKNSFGYYKLKIK